MALIAAGWHANVTPAAGLLRAGLTDWHIVGVRRAWLMALDECLGRLGVLTVNNSCGRKPKRIDFNLAESA